MTVTMPKSTRCWTVLLVSAILLLPSDVASQAKEEPSAPLISFLTNQSDRPDKESLEIGLFSCGQVTANLAAAQRLAGLGESAISSIERELDVIEQDAGRRRYGSRWLELAYARIRGRAAYPRLRRIEGDAMQGLGRPNLDDAIALSLCLTSYVSDSRSGIRRFRCARSPEPRDALDQLILAWEKNDRSMLDASLSPRARGALTALLKASTWEAMRSEHWRGKSGDALAVGYRFGISGRWAEPDETLEQERRPGDAAVLSQQRDFRLDTFFKDKSGEDCGKHSVSFVTSTVGAEKESPGYLVDNSDLGDLLGTIASCATRNQ